jgi:hypothetical protein
MKHKSGDNFIVGVLTGIVISAIGISGLIKILDKGVEFVKIKAVELNAEVSQYNPNLPR